MGDVAGAADALKRSIRLDPTRSAAWNNLGNVLKRQEKWEKALDAFDIALQCDLFNTGAMLNCTTPLLELGRAADAIARLKRAAEIAPDKFTIWTNLGAAYVDEGDKSSALACYKKARALAPPDHHARIDESLRYIRGIRFWVRASFGKTRNRK
jgi:tetratricopeptide (TPR) repeat protein